MSIREDDEEILGPKVPYLSAIGALLYLTNCTPTKYFICRQSVIRFSTSPTQRHWKGIKQVFVISVEQLIWDCFITIKQFKDLLAMLMQDACQIPIKLDLKLAMCSLVEAL